MKRLILSLALLAVPCFVLEGAGDGVARVYLNGDVNRGGQICMDDSIQLIYHLWRDGRKLPCPDAADLDRSGYIDVSDVLGGLRHIFFGDIIPDCPITCGEDDGGYYPE